MTNKRKIQRSKRIYGNLNVKKRRKERKRRIAKAFKSFITMPYYDPFTCRYFRNSQEAIAAAHSRMKLLLNFKYGVTKELVEAT